MDVILIHDDPWGEMELVFLIVQINSGADLQRWNLDGHRRRNDDESLVAHLDPEHLLTLLTDEGKAHELVPVVVVAFLLGTALWTFKHIDGFLSLYIRK